jgi:hypothetical protein
MNLEIRKDRDYSKTITFKQLWLQEQFSRLRKIYTKEELSTDEIKNILLKKYSERKLISGRLFSNTTNENTVMTQEQFIDLFLNTDYILSGYAVLYKDQAHSVNIGSAALKFLLDSRKVYKKKMENSPYGSDQYIYYKILQLTYKVLANSYYGILGEKNSVFYNPHVQNSITMTGQDLTTTAIISLENFLADNTAFSDFDDIMVFIEETLSEKPDDQILRYIDIPKNWKDLLEYFEGKTKTLSDKSKKVLEKIIKKLSSEDINRLYYKNKVMDFIFESSYLRKKFIELSKYKYEEVPEESMVKPLEEFRNIIMTFCFSNIIFEDRYKRVMKDMRKNVIASDTDSVFINLNNYIVNTTKEFNLDKSNKEQQMTIMNIYTDIVTEALHRIFWKMTGNMGLLEEYRPLIVMKSEYLYKRIMATRNKKNYAGLIIGELGRLLDDPVLDVKGLAIKKTNVPKRLRNQFTDILEKDILSEEVIDVRNIINKFDKLGLEIESSLRRGELLYSLPKSIEMYGIEKDGSFTGYKDPSSLEQVRGAIIWNALEPDNQIMPPEKINLLKLKTIEKNHPELLKLKTTHPQKYNTIMKIVYNEENNPDVDISRFGMSVIAIPKGIERIPDYLSPLIDYRTMVSKNMQNGYILLESLGIYTEEVDSTKYKSNIIEL